MTSSEFIHVKGAYEHNLKHITVDIPKGKYVVFTGLSGSGKSSLAMDVVYAEGQRRYLESLSSYARQFLGELKKAKVEHISGLAPAIAVDQKTVSHNPRSTVGTVTEIYDYLRLLYARIGIPHCPSCGKKLELQTIDQIVDNILNTAEDFFQDSVFKNIWDFGFRAVVLAPLVEHRKGSFEQLFINLRRQGWTLLYVDDTLVDLKVGLPMLDKNKFHDIYSVSDYIIAGKKDLSNAQDKKLLRSRIFQAIDAAIKIEPKIVKIAIITEKSAGIPKTLNNVEYKDYSTQLHCHYCDISVPEFEPRDFSFNSPRGACPVCNGLGVIKKVNEDLLLDKGKSIMHGGLIPYSKLYDRDSFFKRLLYKVAEKHNISLDTPIQNLTRGKLDILLYGTGEDLYEVVYFSSKDGSKRVMQTKWEGIVNNLERRYKETQSEYIRTEIEKYMSTIECTTCKGMRLKPAPLAVTVANLNIHDITSLSIDKFYDFVSSLPEKLSKKDYTIAQAIIKELQIRSKFLMDVGLKYLTLSRRSTTLSGGEAQRIRLASQIGTGLTDVIYVLDEPSIGLHARDQHRLINTLKHLRDLHNTVIVVEHDKDTILNADYVFDFGPGAGDAGGKIVAQGTVQEIIKKKASVTGPYLSGKKTVHKNIQKLMKKQEKQNLILDALVSQRRSNTRIKPKEKRGVIELRKVNTHNLKDLTVKFPLGHFIGVTGVSGSGKSSLIVETLYPALRKYLGHKVRQTDAKYQMVFVSEPIDKVIFIDQSPIGRTPRSNPATYTKVFDEIRSLFAQTREAKARGYTAGRFSFNVPGGRCEACKGEGQIKIEMQFMPDVYIECDVCHGKRYTSEVLDIRYKGANIAEILDMQVSTALEFFKDIPAIRRKLEVLDQVGLGYIKLGQPAPTLSGGEAQRVKLASELNKRSTGKTVYILDEPTTGLHFADIEKLILVLKRLVKTGNTVIVIEHNLEFIREVDYIIDLGPEGGENGGRVIFTGSVDEIIKSDVSWTGKALRGEFGDT